MLFVSHGNTQAAQNQCITWQLASSTSLARNLGRTSTVTLGSLILSAENTRFLLTGKMQTLSTTIIDEFCRNETKYLKLHMEYREEMRKGINIRIISWSKDELINIKCVRKLLRPRIRATFFEQKMYTHSLEKTSLLRQVDQKWYCIVRVIATLHGIVRQNSIPKIITGCQQHQCGVRADLKEVMGVFFYLVSLIQQTSQWRLYIIRLL